MGFEIVGEPWAVETIAAGRGIRELARHAEPTESDAGGSARVSLESGSTMARYGARKYIGTRLMDSVAGNSS